MTLEHRSSENVWPRKFLFRGPCFGEFTRASSTQVLERMLSERICCYFNEMIRLKWSAAIGWGADNGDFKRQCCRS